MMRFDFPKGLLLFMDFAASVRTSRTLEFPSFVIDPMRFFCYIAPKYKITLLEWNHDKDHVHVLFKAEPDSELSRFINAYKSASSRLVKAGFPEIRDKLWKEYFWSRSYCLITAGGVPLEMLKEYIRTQGEDYDGRKG